MSVGIALMCTVSAVASPALAGRAAAAGVTTSGSMTDSNSCIETMDPVLLGPAPVSVPVTVSTDALMDLHGTSVALSNTSVTMTIPSGAIQRFVDAAILLDGSVIPVTGDITIAASNTQEQTLLLTVSGAATVHVADGVAQPVVFTLPLPDTTWQLIDTAQGVIFTEQAAGLGYVVDLGGSPLVNVTEDCTPTGTKPIVSLAAAPFPLPMITMLSRVSASEMGGKRIAIRGTNFAGVVDVRFGDASATSFTVNTRGTRIVAVEPPHVALTVDVTVVTAAGSSAATLADEFTYLPPTVTTLSHTSGSHLGGTIVTIRGLNLNGATFVYFGSTYVPAVVNATGRRIVVVTPPEAAGTVDVTVMTGGGTTALAPQQFTFT